MEQKAGSLETRVTYPPALFSVVLLLALVAAVVHVYFGLLLYSGNNSIPMYGIAAVYLVGSVLLAGEQIPLHLLDVGEWEGRPLLLFFGTPPPSFETSAPA